MDLKTAEAQGTVARARWGTARREMVRWEAVRPAAARIKAIPTARTRTEPWAVGQRAIQGMAAWVTATAAAAAALEVERLAAARAPALEAQEVGVHNSLLA